MSERPSSTPALALDQVTKRFAGGLGPHAVSFAVGAGEFVALVGESGSGKTTLLRAVMGLITLDAGVIRLGGEPVRAGYDPNARHRLGVVFQFGGLFPHLSTLDNAALPLRLSGKPREAAARAAREALAACRLDPDQFGTRKPAALSGGQRQRAALARALILRPPVWLLDEPFGALDPVTRAGLADDLRALQRTHKAACVLVTHDMGEALRLADRIVVLDQGRVVADKPPRDLLAHPGGAAAEALLDAPARAHAAWAGLTG
ncbi:MAG: ABC transporter ATP-binding protein [Maricaulaceae bacterium]